MDLICPECRGTVVLVDAETARCETHGGEFRVLFTREAPPVAVTPPVSLELPPDALCAGHPSVPALHVCSGCGRLLCSLCALPEDEGPGRLCIPCFERTIPRPKADAPPVLPADARCVQHPNVAATQRCAACGGFACATCDFAVPGGAHLCPACAVAPRPKLSARRRGLMLGSYALAVFATVGMGLTMAGKFVGMPKEAAGFVFIFMVLLPAVLGLALGFGAIERRLGNPVALWIAAWWNVAIAAVFLLMCLVGMFMK